MTHLICRARTIEFFALVLVVLVATGCGVLDPPVVPGDSEALTPRPFSSIDNVMHNFGLAHDTRDIGLYADCLHDTYQFFLDSEDAKEHSLDFLNKDRDVNVMDQLFQDPDLSSIQFDYSWLSQDEQCWEDGDCVSPVNSDWAEIQFDIDLQLYWSDHNEYVYGRALFNFVEDDERWWIIRVEDRTGLE